MNLSKIVTSSASLALAMVMISACSSQKEPAQAALSGAASAVDAALTPDADKYAPKDVRALQDQLASLQGTFESKDYPAVMSGAPSVTAAAGALGVSVAAKKAADVAETKKLTAEWTDANAQLPKLLASVNARVDELAKRRHPPKGVDLVTARSELADAESVWAKAEASFSAGKTLDAVADTKAVKSKAEAAAAALNMPAPEAAAT